VAPEVGPKLRMSSPTHSTGGRDFFLDLLELCELLEPLGPLGPLLELVRFQRAALSVRRERHVYLSIVNWSRALHSSGFRSRGGLEFVGWRQTQKVVILPLIALTCSKLSWRPKSSIKEPCRVPTLLGQQNGQNPGQYCNFTFTCPPAL